MSRGSWEAALAVGACTSWAAASRLRLKENVSVIWVSPIPLLEVIESIPAIVENCFSRGVATEEAIVSGLAPGRFAVPSKVGKSTLGRALAGSGRYPMTPHR